MFSKFFSTFFIAYFRCQFPSIVLNPKYASVAFVGELTGSQKLICEYIVMPAIPDVFMIFTLNLEGPYGVFCSWLKLSIICQK